MCGCARHAYPKAACNCICPEHKNFDLAAQLASERYDAIVELKAQLAAVEESAEIQYGISYEEEPYNVRGANSLEGARSRMGSPGSFPGDKIMVRKVHPKRVSPWVEYKEGA